MKHNKLVRDKIPAIIRNNGAIPVTHASNDAEYWEKLKDKLIEEAEEFLQEPSEEELADVLEVIDAICDVKRISKDKLEGIKKRKADEKGRFKERIILDEVIS